MNKKHTNLAAPCSPSYLLSKRTPSRSVSGRGPKCEPRHCNLTDHAALMQLVDLLGPSLAFRLGSHFCLGIDDPDTGTAGGRHRVFQANCTCAKTTRNSIGAPELCRVPIFCHCINKGVSQQLPHLDIPEGIPLQSALNAGAAHSSA